VGEYDLVSVEMFKDITVGLILVYNDFSIY